MPRSRTVRSTLRGVSALALLATATAASARDRPPVLELVVEAGRHDREQTPVQISVPSGTLGPDLEVRLARLAEDRTALTLREGGEGGAFALAQVDRPSGPAGPFRLLWILPGAIPAGSRRTFRADFEAADSGPGPWAVRTTPEGHLQLTLGGEPYFRYAMRPVSHPDHPGPHQPRDAYIHPAFSPSGAAVTGDYSAGSHPHHRGFFLAYARAEVGGLRPDFWNIQDGSGKIRFDRLGERSAGPVSARFSAFHRWEAARPDAEPLVVLRERWDVEAFAIPGSPYHLFDLTSTQQATGTPMVLPPYRYGGMAYRGPDSFLPQGALDVLTSEGLDRVRGDQEPARWVDLTGPIAEGSGAYAGAAMFDHPANLNHPTPARIHPTRIPFFCFVPGHDRAVTIGAAAPLVFRYRILVHDGRPDAGLNERLWRDFSEPPAVSLAGPAG